MEHHISTAASKALRKVGSVAGVGAAGAGLVAATVATQLAILAAGYVVMDRVARSQQLKLGDRVNEISREFIRQQATLIKQAGARSWSGVPQAVRDRAVANYQRALGTATAQAQGSAIVGARATGSYK